MKYCINYSGNFRHLNEVDEIILNHYSGSDEIMTFIPELVGDNKDQRIIINVADIAEDDIPNIIFFISKLRQDGYNVAVKTDLTPSKIENFKDAEIPFFSINFAKTMEMAYIQAEMGVSDIYIVEELGFRIKDLEYIKYHFNIQLRVLPNIAQSISNKYINGMTRFWIRPEDTEIYEPYIDVFEIVTGDNNSRLSVVYEIYKQRQWLGNLNDIILDLKEPIVNNRGMNPHFGEMRLNCNKKCLSGRCNLCNQIGGMSNSFVEVGLEVIKKKYTPERTEQEKEEIINKLKERNNESRVDENSNDNGSDSTL